MCANHFSFPHKKDDFYIYFSFSGGTLALCIIGIPILLILIFVVAVNILQSKKPSILPRVLQTWEWLPKPLHSLQPYDACCLSLPCCKSCRNIEQENNELQKVEVTKDGVENQAYEGSDTKF